MANIASILCALESYRMAAFQATATSSCMFLTGAAQNYFVLKLAEEVAAPSELSKRGKSFCARFYSELPNCLAYFLVIGSLGDGNVLVIGRGCLSKTGCP